MFLLSDIYTTDISLSFICSNKGLVCSFSSFYCGKYTIYKAAPCSLNNVKLSEEKHYWYLTKSFTEYSAVSSWVSICASSVSNIIGSLALCAAVLFERDQSNIKKIIRLSR